MAGRFDTFLPGEVPLSGSAMPPGAAASACTNAYDITSYVMFFVFAGLAVVAAPTPPPEAPVHPLAPFPPLSRLAFFVNSLPRQPTLSTVLLDAEDVDSRLTATLQAILATSQLLDRGDAAIVNEAARGALDSAAAAAAAAAVGFEGGVEKHGVGDSQGEGGAAGMNRRWPGPSLGALSVLALLHVSRDQRGGIPATIDVLQQMVSDSVKGFADLPLARICFALPTSWAFYPRSVVVSSAVSFLQDRLVDVFKETMLSWKLFTSR